MLANLREAALSPVETAGLKALREAPRAAVVRGLQGQLDGRMALDIQRMEMKGGIPPEHLG